MKIIDPHLHLFDLAMGDYHWLKQDNPPSWSDKHLINKNFNEHDLKVNAPLDLTGFVHIEAGFDNAHPWREIAWLEDNCQKPFKSVAAIDLTLHEDEFCQQVDKLLSYSSVVGCRHILDEQAYSILQQKKVRNNLAHLADKQLSFDLQMSLADEKAVHLLVEILTNLPLLTVIINHAGWPPFTKEKDLTHWNSWQQGITALSQFKNCAIKCSGWEMTDRNYTYDWQLKVIKCCLEAFGSERVMLASNFPLVLFKKPYNKFWQHYQQLGISEKLLAALTYANAVYWYKFKL